MNRIFGSLIGAVLGLALALFAFKAASLFGPNPEFPVIRGEPDLELRYVVYLLAACPALVFLGAWIGLRAPGDRRLAAWRGIGAVAGTITAFVLLHLLGPLLPSIITPAGANIAAVGFLGGWVALTWMGAVVLGRSGAARLRGNIRRGERELE